MTCTGRKEWTISFFFFRKPQLYPLSYEGGELYVLVRGYLSVAGERALGGRAQGVPNGRVSDGCVELFSRRGRCPGSRLPGHGRVVLPWGGLVCSHVIPMRIAGGGTRRM